MPTRPTSDSSPLPRRTASRSTDEVLLAVAERLHASELTIRTVAQELGESSRRVREAITALLGEGLVRHSGGGPGRLARFTLTAEGVEALAARGRFVGDVVMLFTDLVASTEMISAHGELGAHERRIRHLALLRAAVQRAGGHEVKGLGDGLMVAFGDPVAACRCALDMQRSVAADADGLGLRVGLHSGPVLREDDDLHGSTVIAASRLCDKAASGEVLVSEDVAARISAADGFGLAERGFQELKGLEAPVETFALLLAEPVDPSPEREPARRPEHRRSHSAETTPPTPRRGSRDDRPRADLDRIAA
jgi:class 3 adenylate cyclase